MSDGSIDERKFIDVARTVAGPLAARRYLPTRDADHARLLIMVYWGLTTVPAPPSESPAFINLQVAQTKLQMALASQIPDKIVAARNQLATAVGMRQTENRLREARIF